MMTSEQDIEQLKEVFKDNLGEPKPKKDFWYYFYCLFCLK